MSLEERLHKWGTAEAARIGEPPALVGGRDRRWWPALVAAAAVLVLVGSVFAVTRRTSAPPAPAAEQVVPWADLLPGPDDGHPTLAPATPDPATTRCRAADLRATANNPGQGATGNWFTGFDLTNNSGRPCLLTGRLDGLSGVRGGTRVDLPVSSTPDDFGLVPTVLAPGDSGRVVITYYQRCDTGPAPSGNSYGELRITLLGGELPVTGRAAGLDLGCDAPSAGVNASALGAPGPAPEPAPDARDDLGASIDAPDRAAAGEVLRYRVTLHNPTGAAIALDPCPNYLATLGRTVKQRYQLNCAAAAPVPAGGDEVFAMELRVPATIADGPATLLWSLSVGAQEPVQSQVVVTGGTVVPAEECNGTQPDPPCGAGMGQGQSYPYLLYTHCAAGLRANGTAWVTLKPGYLYRGMDDPDDRGTVTLLAPDHLLYRSDRGPTVDFRPRQPGDPPAPLCD